MERPSVLVGLVLAALATTVSGGAVAATSAPRAELTYTRVDQARHSVWVARADGSGAREIAAPGYAGALARGGRWLSYSGPNDRPGTPLAPLYVVDLLSGKSRRLGEAYPGAASWSPRGAQLAFAGEHGLLLVDAASGKRRELVRGEIFNPSFAPDGTAIVYDRRAGPKERLDIFVVRLADRRIKPLTHDGRSTSPLWADGSIVYQRLRWPTGKSGFSISAVWLMRADGSGKRLLAKGHENVARAWHGLQTVAASRDGKRLLACQAVEFHCTPVSVTIPAGREYPFPEIAAVRRATEISWADDLSSDGTRVLVDVGPPDSDVDHRIYEVPFTGGRPRVLVQDASEASWAH